MFIYVVFDWLSHDISRNILKCYGIIMFIICNHIISIKHSNFYAQLTYVQLGFVCTYEEFLKNITSNFGIL